MKKYLLITVLIVFASVLFADLQVDLPFGHNQTGQAWNGTNYNYQGEVFHVTNLGATDTFSVQIVSTNIPEGWSLVWCHAMGSNQGCHSSHMPAWEFEFPQNATIDFDIQVINIDHADTFDYYFEINAPSLSEPEIINFHFQTADATDNEDNVNVHQIISLKNYPNPFNPETTINYTLPKNLQNVPTLSIYNLIGEKIMTFDNLKSGQGRVVWNGLDLNNKKVSSGIYFYKLNIKNSPIKKMILMK
jgi:hypothetical protein